MKYGGMPAGMWLIYRRSFQRALMLDLKQSPEKAKRIMANAKPKYREIIGKLPEFEKGDIFKTNIVNCAILTSVFLCMDRRPTVEEATVFYEHAMTNPGHVSSGLYHERVWRNFKFCKRIHTCIRRTIL